MNINHKIQAKRHNSNIHINLACVGVCLFVCLYPINVNTAEPIGLKFCVRSHVSPWGRFMNDQNFKNLSLKVFYFNKILKMHKKYYEIRNLFLFLFYTVQREHDQR